MDADVGVGPNLGTQIGLHNGYFDPMPDSTRPLTMQDVARIAGVSTTTVSHTLSGKRPVNTRTAARVMRIITELGYNPDSAGRRLALGRSQMIGLAVPDLSQHYFGRIARGAEQGAAELGYGLAVSSTTTTGVGQEQRSFRMLRNKSLDGLIYTAGREITPEDELSTIAATAPLVLADEPLSFLAGAPSVSSDNREGGRLVGLHLAQLHHQKTVVLAGPSGLASTVDRVSGFQSVFPDALVLRGDFEQESGRRLINRILEQGRRFTAVFACNDAMAWGAITALRAAGEHVPDDVSVVGFDDIDVAPLLGLTTVRQDTIKMGLQAARLLISAIERGSTAATAVLLPVELIARESTAPAPFI